MAVLELTYIGSPLKKKIQKKLISWSLQQPKKTKDAISDHRALNCSAERFKESDVDLSVGMNRQHAPVLIRDKPRAAEAKKVNCSREDNRLRREQAKVLHKRVPLITSAYDQKKRASLPGSEIIRSERATGICSCLLLGGCLWGLVYELMSRISLMKVLRYCNKYFWRCRINSRIAWGTTTRVFWYDFNSASGTFLTARNLTDSLYFLFYT